jgi:ethanolamine ammonia-lyase large subunit
MPFSTRIGIRSHVFSSLRELLAKATPERSGDQLAGIAAASAEERIAARLALAEVPLTRFLDEPLIAPEEDAVTRLILDRHDAQAFSAVRSLDVGAFRDWLLSDHADAEALGRLAPGLTPEMVAAASKLMRNQDLILVARKLRVVTRFRNTLGEPGVLSVRLQPNHPTDDLRGISASILDGLLLGCGDACIGINPASDDPQRLASLWRLLDELIARFEIPTQSCVLAHLTRQIAAIEHGLPLDLIFQSIGGTEQLNRSFGIDLALLREGREAALSLRRGCLGDHVMYFETGQGSALSADAHHGVDQQTLEARAYAVAREFHPLLVNTVVGFIGPEYLYDGRQILRAALEDHFCGKLLGLPMGVDVCYTNHAEADQDDMDVILTTLGVAGVNYIMGVPGADDVMLGYQSTSFHDALYLRRALGLRAAPEFEAWLQAQGIVDAAGTPIGDGSGTALQDLRKFLERSIT